MQRGRGFGCDDGGKFCPEVRYAHGEHVPHDVTVHAVIAVNQPVPHPDDFAPRDLWMTVAQFWRQAVCGFADQFDGALGGEQIFPIRIKLLAAALCAEPPRLPREILDLPERDEGIMPAHRSEALTRARHRGSAGSTRLWCGDRRGV